MHLLSQVGTFQGRKAASMRSPFRVWGVQSQHTLIVLCQRQQLNFSPSCVYLPSHSVPHFLLSPLCCPLLPPPVSVCALFTLLSSHLGLSPIAFFFFFPPVALYAISAVYFAGVMVRLMLTLTPVVCMLSAVAFSSVFEHYMGDDTKREKPPAEDSSDEDDKRNSGNLYDKVRAGQIDIYRKCHCLHSDITAVL